MKEILSSQKWKLLTAVLIFILSLIPILRIYSYLNNTGAGNPSNDDVQVFALIGKILRGNYPWTSFIRECFFGIHFNFFPILIFLADSLWLKGSIYSILIIGVLLAILKLIFLQKILIPKNIGFFGLFLLPILSFLVFSPSQISVFEFDLVTLQVGLTHLGLVIGIWSLLFIKRKPLSIALMSFGGILSSWSWGAGPMVWPVFLFSLWFLNFRKFLHYLSWFAAFLLGCFPYIYFFAINPNRDAPRNLGSLFNFSIFIESFGWPFAQSFSPTIAYFRGWIGLFLFLISILFLMGLRRKLPRSPQVVACLMILLFGIFNIAQVAIFRGLLRPWYSAGFMFFWIGLLGFALNLYYLSAQNRLVTIYGLSIFTFFAIFYITSNRTLDDKSFLLKQRSPTAASCLRNYHSAPTYCGEKIFNFAWGVGEYNLMILLGQELEAQHLSIFSINQRWDLQGDFLLNNVSLEEMPGTSGVFWTLDTSPSPTTFTDYHHLNLFLPSSNSVKWTVKLPKNLIKADFQSAITTNSSMNQTAQPNGATFLVRIKSEDDEEKFVYSQKLSSQSRKWNPLTISLTKYKGQTISLSLISLQVDNLTNDPIFLRFPHIDLKLNSEVLGQNEKTPVNASNTELSKDFQRPELDDLILDFPKQESWKITNMHKDDISPKSIDRWIVEQYPSMEYKSKLDLTFGEIEYLYLKMGVSSKILNISGEPYLPTAKFFLELNGNKKSIKEIDLPLFADDKVHEYTLPLKLLTLPKKTKITSLRIEPIIFGDGTKNSWIQLGSIGFIGGSKKKMCL